MGVDETIRWDAGDEEQFLVRRWWGRHARMRLKIKLKYLDAPTITYERSSSHESTIYIHNSLGSLIMKRNCNLLIDIIHYATISFLTCQSYHGRKVYQRLDQTPTMPMSPDPVARTPALGSYVVEIVMSRNRKVEEENGRGITNRRKKQANARCVSVCSARRSKAISEHRDKRNANHRELCVFRQYACEMLFPYPTYGLRRVVLIARQPQLAFHADDVKDLTRHIDQIWYTAFTAIMCDVEFKKACSEEKYLRLVSIGGRGWQILGTAANG